MLVNQRWVVETPEVRSPALFGFSVPKPLLPEGLHERFSPQELRLILLHELQHLRRRDIAWNCLSYGCRCFTGSGSDPGGQEDRRHETIPYRTLIRQWIAENIRKELRLAP